MEVTLTLTLENVSRTYTLKVYDKAPQGETPEELCNLLMETIIQRIAEGNDDES